MHRDFARPDKATGEERITLWTQTILEGHAFPREVLGRRLLYLDGWGTPENRDYIYSVLGAACSVFATHTKGGYWDRPSALRSEVANTFPVFKIRGLPEEYDVTLSPEVASWLGLRTVDGEFRPTEYQIRIIEAVAPWPEDSDVPKPEPGVPISLSTLEDVWSISSIWPSVRDQALVHLILDRPTDLFRYLESL